jgi:hypothetical protein
MDVLGCQMGGWKVVIASSGVCMDAADGAAFSRKYSLPGKLRDILFPNTFKEVKMAMSFVYPYQLRLSDSSYQELLEVDDHPVPQHL